MGRRSIVAFCPIGKIGLPRSSLLEHDMQSLYCIANLELTMHEDRLEKEQYQNNKQTPSGMAYPALKIILC
jgi:hypothetical protein